MASGRSWAAIVDDDGSVRRALARLLVASGFEATTFESGRAFLDSLTIGSPDFVVLDLHMPGMNGLELLKVVKEQYPRLKVYMITAYDDADSRQRAVEYGCDDYLTKPIDFTVLRTRIGLAGAPSI